MGSIVQLAIGSGAVGAPSYSFNSDTTTGMFLNAVGVLELAAAGVKEALIGGGMVLDTATGGAKGVGTLNATGLYINGTALGTVTGFATPSGLATLAASAGAATTAIRSDANIAIDQTIAPTWSGIHTWSVAGKAIQITGSGSFIRIQDTGAAGSILELKATNLKAIINTNWTTTTTPMSLQINSVEAIGIATTGAVTIAAPSSGSTLTANVLSNTGSVIAFSDGTETLGFSSDASHNWLLGTIGAHNLTLFTTNAGRVVIGSSGNVTVNAPSSGSALTINAAASAQPLVVLGASNNEVAQFDSTQANGPYIILTSSATAVGYVGSALALSSGNATDLAVRSQNVLYLASGGGTNRVTIGSSGNVTVNAPSSGVAVTINGVSGTHSTQIADSATSLFNAGFLEIPVNTQNANYTTVLADSAKAIYHSDGTARTYTIAANSSVAYPIGTTLTFINDASAAVNVTIAINTDTLVLFPAGTTGSRTLAQFGRATAHKVTATRWIITGSNLT